MKKNKVRTFAALCAAVQEPAGPDKKELARTADDVALELHGLGNALHKAGLHRQGAAADVAVGIIDDITEELKDGG